MEKRALLIGINYNNDPSLKLNGCVNDVFTMSNMLIDVYSYKKENIKILYDNAAPNLIPNRTNILRELRSIIASSKTSSELWIHYSGHGTYTRDRNGDELDGRDEAIVPCDVYQSGVITDDELLAIFSQSKCLTYLMFDCCHSGSICDLQWRFEYVPRTGKYIRYNESKRILTNPKILMISGCRDNQTSADAYNIEMKMAMGAMTNALIDSIRANNYNATFLKIYADMCGWLSKHGHTQFPCLSSSNSSPTSFKMSKALTQQSTQKRQLAQPQTQIIQQKQINQSTYVTVKTSMRELMMK
jgi:hypothetical protein